jgi:hypothetical protein
VRPDKLAAKFSLDLQKGFFNLYAYLTAWIAAENILFILLFRTLWREKSLVISVISAFMRRFCVGRII